LSTEGDRKSGIPQRLVGQATDHVVVSSAINLPSPVKDRAFDLLNVNGREKVHGHVVLGGE